MKSEGPNRVPADMPNSDFSRSPINSPILMRAVLPLKKTGYDQLRGTFEYSKTEEDGFLYGLLVRITLLAADSDGLMF